MGEEIRQYDSMQTFLNDCKSMLMQKECENNVILGICNRFLNNPIDLKKFLLFAAFDKDGTIISCAVTTPHQTFLATFITQSDIAVQPLVNYFNHHQVNLKGLSGETSAVYSFVEVYQKPVTKFKNQLLNILNTLQNIELVPNSVLSLATLQDLSILTIWLKNFQIDAGLLPSPSDEEIQAAVQVKIEKKVLYKLILNENKQPVSMVAIVRETDNFAIISWVYTPLELRGKGFATTAVYQLTKLLLDTQKKSCALFTDKSNPVSNKIYRNIGYQPVAEYLDVDFEPL